MRKAKWITLLSVLVVTSSSGAVGSAEAAAAMQSTGRVTAPGPETSKSARSDMQSERVAFKVLLDSVQRQITSAAEAMPADKYGFAPSAGEFQGVRTFGRQVKHLAATNQILAAAALGEIPPASAGDETGPETVRTKAEILVYLNESFGRLRQAIDAIGDDRVPVKSSPISPLRGEGVTRTALIAETLIHAFDHYGQIVEYLRMNGVVPPASLP